MRTWIGLLAGALWAHLAHSAPPASSQPAAPVISIIIDDLGGRLDRGMRAVRLPGPVACSFLPHSPHTRELALSAHRHDKEVLLHLPMQPVERRPVDAGGLFLDMTQKEFVQALQEDLAAVPHVSGINNHMGSLLTRHPGHMLWLMQEISRRGELFFVDSRTTSATVALQLAAENHVPSMQRDVFLDHDPSPRAIRAQFERLLALAKERGAALGIGHPHPSTLAVLEELLPSLQQRGVRLVSVAEMIRLQQARRAPWQASLSPSPPVAKSSKPSPSSTCCVAPESRL